MRKGCLAIAIMGLLITAGISCPAQSGRRLPDSINTSQDKPPEEDAGTGENTTTDDHATTGDSTAGSETEGIDSAAIAALLADTAVLRKVPAAIIRKYKDDDDFAYANDPDYWSTHPQSSEDSNTRDFRVFWYYLLAALILFVVYRIIVNNKLFYGSSRVKNDPAGEETDKDLDLGKLDRMIRESAAINDYRNATRYLFLKALYKLGERQLIHYGTKATNHEYIGQLSGHALSAPFGVLVNAYEYVWYGDFAIGEEQFGKLSTWFQDFYRTVDGYSARSVGVRHNIPAILLLIAVLGPAISSCHIGKAKILDREITLSRKDKRPYGTYIAYEDLRSIFPNAEISVRRSDPSSLPIDRSESKQAYIIIAPIVQPDETEITEMLNFVAAGNTVFIAAFHFGDTLLNDFHIQVAASGDYSFFDGRTGMSIYNPVNNDSAHFSYPGISPNACATKLDVAYATILGRDVGGKPNFIRYSYKGGGALYLHFAPIAFTNFFLLYKDNKTYYDDALSYLPISTKKLMWDEYFFYGGSGAYDKRNFSAFQYILSVRSLRWAFWLLLLLLLLVLLIESKRRQRKIPVISGLKNTSLDFVRTIGRLYYQRRDNHNLAMKMVAQFQDQVRTRYNMPALALYERDNGSVDRLAQRSGYPKDKLRDLVNTIVRIRDEGVIRDEELLEFHRKMNEFYKYK